MNYTSAPIKNPIMDYTTIPTDEIIHKTIDALGKNGMNAEVVETGAHAKARVETLIPKGAEVMTMTSVTLQETGIQELIDTSGEYDSVKKKLGSMREGEAREKRMLGAAPDFAMGSVHAVTQEGEVIVASNTGSQLSASGYGAERVVWIVGAQKIVKNREEGIQRIQDYILPLETERAKKAYKLPETYKSNVSKVLIFNREVNKDRIHLIFVKEKLGF